ncbi:MAG: hypothetical protein AAGJ10_05775 [Bacteroidota bacterium]
MFATQFARLLTVALYGFLSFFWSGCQGHDHDHEDDAFNAQAIALHDSLVVVESDVRTLLADLQAQADGADVLTDSLTAIAADLDTWETFLVEPEGAHEDGHDHGHDHDHDHDHDHSHDAPDVTPEQMVEVQQALLDAIRVLHTRLSALPAASASATAP